MKIALDFKESCKQEIVEKMIKRNFDVTDNSSFGTVWVYGLSHIDYSKGRIELNQSGSMKFFVILLEDLDYFEIYSE